MLRFLDLEIAQALEAQMQQNGVRAHPQPGLLAGRVRHQLDVYRPCGQRIEGAPVLLQVHGGAWVIGEKDHQGLPLMNALARRGFVCVAINYRLSPKATFPDHLVDCKRALAWIRANVADYGGDPGWVAVTGGSAGGHLASLLALTPGEASLQPGFEQVDTRVAACVPLYGAYDFLHHNGVDVLQARGKSFVETQVMKSSPREALAAWEHASPPLPRRRAPRRTRNSPSRNNA